MRLGWLCFLLVFGFVAAAASTGCSLVLNFASELSCDPASGCPKGLRCVAGRCIDSGPTCGDYTAGSGEACDDGNLEDGDGCSADCKSDETCGNRIVDRAAGEVCDDGPGEGDGLCLDDCSALQLCGDGSVEGGEVCDDGPGEGEGACLDDCTAVQACGNSIVEGSGTCDDRGTSDCGPCNADCSGAGNGSICGDGARCPETEACDDGFTDACGPCNADCSGPGTGPSSCGDGVLCPWAGETCDDGYSDACGTCNADCTGAGTGPGVCGDGTRCPEVETCDDGFTDGCGTCNATCTGAGSGAVCGDGDWCPELEACDDGFQDACGTCDATCVAPGSGPGTCGDGTWCTEFEICDDGTGEGEGPCLDDCSGIQSCGDGVTAGTEGCDDNNSVDWDGCTTCQPSEFLVKAEMGDYPYSAEIAMAADGSFVIVWEFKNNVVLGQGDGDSTGIFARRYASDGTLNGAEFQVNTETVGTQERPSVAMSAAGELVVVWRSANSSLQGVFGQRYSSAGTPLGSEFPVSTANGNQAHPAVAMAAAGQFVVAWESWGVSRDVYVRRYASDGTASSGEFLVSTPFAGWYEDHADVAIADDGSFVVVWAGSDQVPNEEVFGQRYASDGTTSGPEFQANTYTAGLQGNPSVAMAGDGRFVVVWESLYQDGSGMGVFGQRYASDGTPDGSELRVNTYTDSEQHQPDVSMAPDGRSIVVWRSPAALTGGSYATAQLYGSGGVAVGSEIIAPGRPNTTENAAVAMGVDGRFAIVWSYQVNSNGLPANIFDVYGKRYDPLGVALAPGQ